MDEPTRSRATIDGAPDARGASGVRRDSRSLNESVHARIRDAILSAEIKPGRRLVENDLAVWLDVSRTPVREALLRLEQEGFVRRLRGWVVREYEPSEVRARLECRLAVEGYAARLACSRRDEAQLESLAELRRAMSSAGLAREAFNELNDRFHRIIMEAAGNLALSSLHAQTKMNYWDLSVPVVFSTEDDRVVDEQHAALLAALEARDGDAAERVARAHVQVTMDKVVAELALRYRDFKA
jgi:DNA-binding GntR family transcriptional regulator